MSEVCVGSVFRSLDKSFVESSHGGSLSGAFGDIDDFVVWLRLVYFIGQIMQRRRRVNVKYNIVLLLGK